VLELDSDGGSSVNGFGPTRFARLRVSGWHALSSQKVSSRKQVAACLSELFAAAVAAALGF